MDRIYALTGIGATAALVLTGCGANGTLQNDQNTEEAGEVAEDQEQQSPQEGEPPFSVEEQGSYDSPWALEFLPGTELLLITTQPGTLILKDLDSEEDITVEGAPDDVVAEGQGGLADVVVAPDFEQSREIYLSWVTSGEGGTGAVVGRAELETDGSDASLEDLTVIWEQQPKTSGSGHFAARMAFSADGEHLFVTSGDRQELSPAQDMENTLGTIVRLTPEGDPAPGNPFSDEGGVTEEIWSYGHRNPLGIDLDADGRLWSSEMGPAGGDELNLIEEGNNYGWPEVSQGEHYDGEEIPDHSEEDDYTAPHAWWTPSISPGSLMIYGGDLFEDWEGDAFMGALSGEALVRVELDGEDAGEEEMWEMGARIRDVAQAPDGSIWLIEDGDDANLLRLTPDE